MSANAGNRRVTVGDACLAARAPQTTALRAIQRWSGRVDRAVRRYDRQSPQTFVPYRRKAGQVRVSLIGFTALEGS